MFKHLKRVITHKDSKFEVRLMANRFNDYRRQGLISSPEFRELLSMLAEMPHIKS